MSQQPDIKRHGYVNEDGDFVCIARIVNAAGSLVTQATVSSIALTVTVLDEDGDADSDYTPVVPTAPVVADTIYDTAQTNSVTWPNPPHTSGYNFRHVVPAACVPVGGVNYAVEYTLTLASSAGTIQVPFGVYARKLAKS